LMTNYTALGLKPAYLPKDDLTKNDLTKNDLTKTEEQQ